ncbi:hypothetical protein V6N11_006915 [Hibiscus sabdariffa]|uniref:WRKY domain-containing protein n=1 Tax=Hibiscus sabdariffa TaxID=183260 RepID=A0ABR2RS92_9ROSI
MEKAMLLNELTQGRELTDLLRKHLHPSSPPETRHLLLDKILSSYDKALSMLNSSANSISMVQTKPNVSSVQESPGSDASDKNARFKKRKTCSGWSEQVRVCCSGTSFEGLLDDGYCWRKYGQKDILGSNFPRAYYRCTHRYSQGCLAAKQVQKSNNDPTILEVKYRGRHTCSRGRASHFIATTVPSTTEYKEKGDHSRQQQQLEEKQKQSKEVLVSFETGLKVKTEDLDNRDDIFPSFSFPIESEEVENGLFVSPATSESNYFSVSPFHMGSFGLCQNVQTSESDLTEIISAPTSVTNSPIVDLDISSLEKLEFDPSFLSDNPEFFY